MEYIKRSAIDDALSKVYRQYLTGHLELPQPLLEHIDSDIEVGISFYREFTADKPHVHPVAEEHGYVLSGSVRCRILDGSGTEMEFDEGDFFVVRPGEPHASKNAPGTKVLFIKSPGLNDKTIVEVDEETERWLSSWD